MRTDEFVEAFGVDASCDRCATTPLVKFALNEFSLNFCGHHANDNEAALSMKGFSVIADFRDRDQKSLTTLKS